MPARYRTVRGRTVRGNFSGAAGLEKLVQKAIESKLGFIDLQETVVFEKRLNPFIAQVSPEAIFNSDPDILLFAGGEKDMKELIGRPGWSDMRAVKARRAHATSRVELLIPGPRTIDGIQHLAELLHPPAPPQ